MPDEDYTRGQLDPAEVPPRGAVQPSGDPTELCEEGMATFHRATDPTDPGLPGLAALGRLHAEAGRGGPFLTGAVP